MERIARVAHDFNKMNPLKQVFLGNHVIQKLGENPVLFGNLPVPLADLTAANNTLYATYRKYKAAGRFDKGAFVFARQMWLEKFRQTANAVNAIAKGSGATISLSGFKITTTETSPSREPAFPARSNVEYTRTKGCLKAQVQRVPDAMGYVFTAATTGVEISRRNNQLIIRAGNELVSIIIGTQRTIEFNGLPSKKDVNISTAAFNRAGISIFSKIDNVGMP